MPKNKTLSQLWPMRRDNPDFMEGFQRGYAEALTEVLMAGADAMDAPEALRDMAATIEDPIGKAQAWVAEDDGSVP